MKDHDPVRRPLRRVELHFEPVDPNMPAATPGPLHVVSRPLKRAELTFEPVAQAPSFDLVLTLETDTDPLKVTSGIIELLSELSTLSQMNGKAKYTIDFSASKSEPGLLTLRIVPGGGNTFRLQEDQITTPARKLTGVRHAEVNYLNA
jgi:hypothetical protein